MGITKKLQILYYHSGCLVSWVLRHIEHFFLLRICPPSYIYGSFDLHANLGSVAWGWDFWMYKWIQYIATQPSANKKIQQKFKNYRYEMLNILCQGLCAKWGVLHVYSCCQRPCHPQILQCSGSEINSRIELIKICKIVISKLKLYRPISWKRILPIINGSFISENSTLCFGFW